MSSVSLGIGIKRPGKIHVLVRRHPGKRGVIAINSRIQDRQRYIFAVIFNHGARDAEKAPALYHGRTCHYRPRRRYRTERVGQKIGVRQTCDMPHKAVLRRTGKFQDAKALEEPRLQYRESEAGQIFSELRRLVAIVHHAQQRRPLLLGDDIRIPLQRTAGIRIHRTGIRDGFQILIQPAAQFNLQIRRTDSICQKPGDHCRIPVGRFSPEDFSVDDPVHAQTLLLVVFTLFDPLVGDFKAQSRLGLFVYQLMANALKGFRQICVYLFADLCHSDAHLRDGSDLALFLVRFHSIQRHELPKHFIGHIGVNCGDHRQRQYSLDLPVAQGAPQRESAARRDRLSA